MSEILKKSYEISIWENRLVTENFIDEHGEEQTRTYQDEVKIAVIGSDKMDAPARVYSPVLTERNNGEKSLTFLLKYRYYDERIGDFVNNPFVPYLINERKIKLKYKDKWYDFIIKNHDETTEEYEFTYTATDAFINELAKTGYDLVFDTELNNNQGTTVDLGKKIVEGTNWVIDEENSDIIQQKIDEPVYNGSALVDFQALNVDTNELETIAANTQLFIFYSYVNAGSGSYLHFIKQTSGDYLIDDNNVIIASNYRINGDFTIVDNNIQVDESSLIQLGEINTNFKAYRLVYNQLTTYDPIMEQTVDRYEINYNGETQEVYHYKVADYATTGKLVNFVTNGSGFGAQNGTDIAGWNNLTATNDVGSVTYKFVTIPELSIEDTLESLSSLKAMTTCLKVNLPQTISSNETGLYQNSLFNSGFMDNAVAIDHISKGERFLARIRTIGRDVYQRGYKDLHIVVAKCSIDKNQSTHIKGAHPYVIKKESDIILNFNGPFIRGGYNIVRDGALNNEKTQYLIDGVVQEPSVKNVYMDNGVEYIYNAYEDKYIQRTTDNWADYYLLTATATQTISNSALLNSGDTIGIFVYNTSTHESYRIESIEITRYIEDENGEPLFIGSAPTTKIYEVDNYYLKPKAGLTKNEISTYNSLESLADDLGITAEQIVPIHNEKSEKILSINENKSNRFNLLQTICETFECWLNIEVAHDENGRLKLDKNKLPIKKISFKNYAGKDNFVGFRYGVNLNSINRTINSDEFVTKLIVGEPNSDFTPDGVITIKDASSNPSGESYILNFDYYLNQGLIQNKEEFERDLDNFYKQLKQINNAYKTKSIEASQLSLACIKAKTVLDIYESAYAAAQENYAKEIRNFESITGHPYSYYETHASEIVDNDTAKDSLYRIYGYIEELNKYGGLLPNAKAEYQELNLKYNGAEDFSLTVVTTKVPNAEIYNTTVTISDYTPGINFTLIDNDNIRHEFQSSDLQKEFVVEDVLCTKIIIDKIPQRYQIEYAINNKKYIVPAGPTAKFDIYDVEQNVGMTRRFKISPDAEYAAEAIGIQGEINKLLEEKKELEDTFFAKYENFIQEGTWESNDYINPELYYLDALQTSKTSSQPKIEYTINVSEISEIEGFENYDFNVGDKTYIEDVEFFGYRTELIGSLNEEPIYTNTPIKEEVIVTEIEWHLDEPENNIITIQNYKTRFQDLFQSIAAAVQSVQYNEASYAQIASILDANGNINPELLINSLGNINSLSIGSSDNTSIEVTDEGLLIRNLTNPSNLVIIKNSGIELSKDGGITWERIVSTNGLNTDQLTTGTINTQNILITNGNDLSFRWDAYGLSAYGYNEEGLDLNSFVRFDKYGVYGIQNNLDYVVQSLEDIKDKANFGLTWDGFFIKNRYEDGYVSVSSTDDIQVVSNDIERIKIGYLRDSDDYGIRIKNGLNETVFETDDEGNLSVTGTIRAAAGEIGGFGISETSLYKNEFGESGSIYISSGYESPKSIAGSSGNNTWALAVSDNFGVDTTGTLYATAARLEGTIYASDGIFTGQINAQGGTFADSIKVGPSEEKYIVIDSTGKYPVIASSDYIHNTNTGWMIRGDGDAIFQNVSVRGAIKTAVFEYSEIQAVGGAFLFRPSSTIRTASIDGDNLVLTVENPRLFKQNEWVKVSNINSESDGQTIINDGGLTHVYKIGSNPTSGTIVLLNAAADFSSTSSITDRTDDIIDYNNNLMPMIPMGEDDEYLFEFEADGDLYSFELEGLELEEELIYYSNFDFERYSKVSKAYEWTEVVPGTNEDYEDDSDDNVATVTREIVYFGNLHLLDRNVIGTNEDFVVATENGVTKIYTTQGGEHHFEIYGTEEPTEITDITDLIGGALISFGYDATDSSYGYGEHNYGIGINSSDNYVDLPERAISLFETRVDPNANVKINYDFKGILGTLPPLGNTIVNQSIYTPYMAGTQGIFTNNMYIGDADHYLAFYSYTDEQENVQKKLRIAGADIVFTYHGQETDLDDIVDDVTEQVSLLGGHFIYKSSTSQSGLTPPSANIVECIENQQGQDVTDDPTQWGHNVHIGSNGIKLRYNEISYSDWTESGLTLYKPPTLVNNVLTQGAAAATLTINGLVLSEGGIVAGTLGTNNYLYISSEDHPTEESGITINGFTPDPDENSEKWREVIGTNFGVTNAGTLYASNAYVSGEIYIGSGHIANGVTISSGSTETKTLESIVIEVDGTLYYQYTPSGGPTYDVYAEEDDEHNIHYYYIDANNVRQEVQYEDLDKTIYYQYTSSGTTYDVYTEEDDEHNIHYYYIDDNEQEQEVQYEDLDKVDGEVVIVDGEVVIVYKNGINQSIESLDEQIDAINGAIIIDSSEPSITIKAEKAGTEATAQTVFTESRISFQKIIDNQEIEVLYIDSTENEGVIDINNARVQNSLRIGELELFNLNGGIGIRRT